METTYYYSRRLRDALTERTERNPRYSLRAFATTLGLDAGTFCQILSGKRFPSTRLARRLLDRLSLSPEEQSEFLTSLAEAKANAGHRRIAPELRTLLKQSTGETIRNRKELSIDLFRVIADWYHFAILELPFIENGDFRPRRMAKALGISESEVNSAVERLIELDLLQRKNGRLERLNTQLSSADRHLTTAAHRRRQKQILQKSIESLENDPIETRNHTAMTFAIDTEKIPEAKKRIDAFMNEMTEFLQSGKKNQVYEMTVNLFPIQKNFVQPKTQSPKKGN